MTISYEKFALKEVINASGKMTILGVSKVSENVLAAQRFGGEHFFEMADLSEKTGAYIGCENWRLPFSVIEGGRCADRFFCFSRDCPICRGFDWSRRPVPCLSSLHEKNHETGDRRT